MPDPGASQILAAEMLTSAALCRCDGWAAAAAAALPGGLGRHGGPHVRIPGVVAAGDTVGRPGTAGSSWRPCGAAQLDAGEAGHAGPAATAAQGR